MIRDILALVGVAALFAVGIACLSFLAHCIHNVAKVARDYREALDDSCYLNPLVQMNHELKRLKDRVYKAERDASNANFKIDRHGENYKHTKTAKKVAIDKERKKIEQEYQHDVDVRGGDGM
jgi:collagenase-like PrtC family protease